jgi:hypothetical protein
MTLARPVRPPPRLLPSLPLTHLRRAPAPPRPAPLLLLITWRRVPLRPPQAMLPLPPELAPATGVQAPTYQRGPVPQLLPLHPPPRTSTLRSPGRRAPAACAAGTPRSAARDARGAALRAPSCAPPAPAPVAATPDRARGSQEWAGRISRRSGSPSAGGNVRDASKTWNAIKIKNGDKNPTYQRAGGEHLEVPRGRSLRSIRVSTALHARVSAYPRSRGSEASVTSPARWGPPPPSSQRSRAASPSEARSAGGGGR